MSNENDHLSGEIAIEASLTESGIKASAKSRFISALDRMFGGIFDIPAAFMEGTAAQRRLKDRLMREASELRQKVVLEGEISLERLEQAAAVASKEIQIRAILNKASIAAAALEDLSENGSNHQGSEDIDEDWLNMFGRYAENASTERLQHLWGKILSGEIRKPGSFSLTTLRVISELDQNTAELFQKYVVGILDGSLIVKKGDSFGQELIDLTFLEEVGLLQEASGSIGTDQKFNEDGNYVILQKNMALSA